MTLSEPFFRSVMTGAVPLNLNVVAALRRGSGSPMRLDIYTWLVHRLYYLRRQTTVPWEALALQFGGDYKHVRQFKAQFLRQLAAVRLFYPEADLQPAAVGIVLRPSPKHIAPTKGTTQPSRMQ